MDDKYNFFDLFLNYTSQHTMTVNIWFNWRKYRKKSQWNQNCYLREAPNGKSLNVRCIYDETFLLLFRCFLNLLHTQTNKHTHTFSLLFSSIDEGEKKGKSVSVTSYFHFDVSFLFFLEEIVVYIYFNYHTRLMMNSYLYSGR